MAELFRPVGSAAVADLPEKERLRAFGIQELILPAPSAIARSFADERAAILSASRRTLVEVLGERRELIEGTREPTSDSMA